MGPKRKATSTGPAAKKAKTEPTCIGGVNADFVEKAFSAKVLSGGKECFSEGRIDKGSIKVRDTGKSIAFSTTLSGSNGDEYSVTATVAQGKLVGCVCSCFVGKFKKPCKHSCALLLTVADCSPGELSVADAKPKPRDAAKDKADQKAIAEQVKKFTACSVNQLKDLLRLNKQGVTGTKDELVRRVAEGVVLGALPKCPECHGGNLKYNSKTRIYSCGGYFDDDIFKPCAFSSADVERVKWCASEEE